jgi:hypothetical protein
MAKTDNTSKTTNRRQDIVAGTLGLVGTGDIVYGIDIARTNASFVRASTATDLDDAEATAAALAATTGNPVRVTVNGAEYRVFHRGLGG